MSETFNLKLPLIAAAQAQKHVTVNEALARIDAALQMIAVSRSISSPPASIEGEVYLVGASATGDWTNNDGALAFAVGGGWEFILPHAGWKLWIADEAKWVAYNGTNWADGVLATTQSNAAMRADVVEFDIDFSDEMGSIVTQAVIPAGAVVFAITGRVTAGFDGNLTDFALGVSDSVNRYGAGLGTATAAFVHGLTSQPQSYYSATPLVLTANGGNFGSGSLRLAIHLMQFDLPRL